MKKKTVVILSLLSALITLIYILGDYYGWNRYFALHLYNPSSYIEVYKKLEKADPKNRVIINFTTTPERLSKLKPLIASLLDQTVQVSEIALTVPYDYKVPDDISKLVSLYRYKKEYGEMAGLIPVVLRERDADTKIIVVKDDLIYPKDYIQTLVESSEKSPNKIIIGDGGVLVKPLFFPTESLEKVSDDILDKCGKDKTRVKTESCRKSLV